MGNSKAYIVLEDGSAFEGCSFGANTEAIGEVVFNTGMVGYPESFTDPSYRGQILALTYPLIGNYGVPSSMEVELSCSYESNQIHMAGLVVSEYSTYHHHWTAERDLSSLLIDQGVVGIEGVDTRALTKKLRERGTMGGRVSIGQRQPERDRDFYPARHVVSEVSVRKTCDYRAEGFGKARLGKRVAVIDCGCKNTIIRSLLIRGVDVVRLPWDSSLGGIDVDGVLFSNGPGDPQACGATIETARQAIESGIPALGICLGHQILSLASGAKTYKLKFGHRSQNQPCRMGGKEKFFITSQNHGYAVDAESLPEGWEAWFTNVNDGTNEGVRHTSKPVMGVQFHPEAMPGPVDTGFLFDEFITLL
jgi:carbamoyl-phosphate synthase small subunit